jgi:hypothetical protein
MKRLLDKIGGWHRAGGKHKAPRNITVLNGKIDFSYHSL